MTKKQNETDVLRGEFLKANMPEILKDLSGDCKWQYYMPSGGYEFQKDFTEFWVPYLNGKIKELTDGVAMRSIAAAKFSEIQRSMAEARNAVLAAREYFERNREMKEKVLASTGVAAELFLHDLDWLDSAPEHAHGVWTAMSSVGTVSTYDVEAKTNIAFLTAFRDFFLADREFDLLMWVKGIVDAKYRTKVSRVCFRLAKEQITRLAQIENCNTILAVTYREFIFERPVQVLAEGTRIAYNALKAAKKYGIKDGPTEDSKLRANLNEAMANARWDIVRPEGK